MLVKMAESNHTRDAQLAKHSERMDRMEILFDHLDNQLPNLAQCVEVCSEVRSSTTAIASSLTTIRDQTTTTAQTVTQHFDNMEETIWDTFVDLKVDVLKATLTLMENTIASRFTAVDMALAQLASPLRWAGASAWPHSPAPPDFPTPPDADTDCPGLARPTGDDDTTPPNRFQPTTTFSPGSLFPAGNWVSHMREADNPDEDCDHGTWRTRDRADTGAHTPYQPRAALPATGSSHFRDGRPAQAPTQRHPWGDEDVGTSPNQFHHNRVPGRRDMCPDTHRAHCWLFDNREVDGDKEGYAVMGGPIKSPSNIERF